MPSLAVFVVAAIGLALLLRSHDTDNTPTLDGTVNVPGLGEPVEVLHQIVEYKQDTIAECVDADVTGEFSSMVFETWADPRSGLWRQEVRYPDGSTRTTVAFGNPAMPTELFSEGEVRGQTVRCGQSGIVVAEPSQGSIYFLKYPDDSPQPPTRPTGEWRAPVPAGTVVQGEHVNSLGQASQLWRQVINGSDDAGPIEQVTTWWVDPTTGEVTEGQFVNDIAGPGRYGWTATVTTNDHLTVSRSLFNTDGLERR